MTRSSRSMSSKSVRSSTAPNQLMIRTILHLPNTRGIFHLLVQIQPGPLSRRELMPLILTRSIASAVTAPHTDLKRCRLSPLHGAYLGKHRPSPLSHGTRPRSQHQCSVLCLPRLAALRRVPQPGQASSILSAAARRPLDPVPLTPEEGWIMMLIQFHLHRSRQYRHDQVTLFPPLLACLSASGCKSSLHFSCSASELLTLCKGIRQQPLACAEIP